MMEILKQDQVKMIESLERCMRSYPDVWTESSMHHLLGEVANAENSGAEERLHTVMMRMVFPMAQILEAEHAVMKEERQRMQDATLALQRVQQECHHALLDFTNQHTTSARDLEELGKALEANRQAAEEASQKLAERNAHIQFMVQSHRDLLVRLVCGGPSEFVRWARQEIHSQTMTHLTAELERSWWPFTNQVADPADCSISISPKKEQEEEEADITCHQDVTCDKTSFPGTNSVSASFLGARFGPIFCRCKFSVCCRCKLEVCFRCKIGVFCWCKFATFAICKFGVCFSCKFGICFRCKFGVFCWCKFGVCSRRKLDVCLRCFVGAMLASFPGSSLACLVVSETLRQVEESYRSVRGPFSVPSAVASFWMGLAGRMTCLAIVTLFPQVMQKMTANEV